MYQGASVRGSVGDSLQTTADIMCPFQLAVAGDTFPLVDEFWTRYWGKWCR